MTVDTHHNYVVDEGVVVKNCDTDRYALYTDSLHSMTGVY